jgi:two-component system OmpR family response regulator
VLVVDDELNIAELVATALRYEGFEVQTAADGRGALAGVRSFEPDLVVLDVMLPDLDGFEVQSLMRAAGLAVPVLFLTARDAVEDRVYGLDSGADDYLTKPFDFAELSARVRAMLRRNSGVDRMRIAVGRLVLDSETMRVTHGDTVVPTSPKEFALLRLLAQEAGTPVSRQRILDSVWGGVGHIDPNIVDQYISYLRHKLDPEECGFKIVTIRGSGYQVELPE